MRGPARRILVWAVFHAALLCGPSSPAWAAPGGRVLQTVAGGAYLDAGASEGLQPGTAVVIRAASGSESRWAVSRISDHHAFAVPADSTGGSEAGAVWTVPAGGVLGAAGRDSSAPSAAEPARRAVPLPDPAALSIAWNSALSEPAPLRPAVRSGSSGGPGSPGVVSAPRGARGLDIGRWVRVTPALEAWPYRGRSGKSYAGGALALRGRMGLPRQLRLNTDCDLYERRTRPAGDRLRPRTDAAVLLHALALEYAPAGGARVSVGRTRPAFGGPLIDGAALSWRSARSGPEVGVYGGAIPDPLALGFSSERVSFGAFASVRGPFAQQWNGSARGRLSLVRAKGISREEARFALSFARGAGVAIEGGGAGVHLPGETALADAWAGLRKHWNASEAALTYRRDRAVLDPVEEAAYREVLGSGFVPAGLNQRVQASLSTPVGRSFRLESAIGRAAGGFSRWTGEGRLSHPLRFGPLSRWLVGYRGSSGWQEGHEGELGGRLELSSWKLDLTAGGGLIRQRTADRTTPLGRGTIRVMRPLGEDGSIDLLVWGQGNGNVLAGAGRLAVSWRLDGRPR